MIRLSGWPLYPASDSESSRSRILFTNIIRLRSETKMSYPIHLYFEHSYNTRIVITHDSTLGIRARDNAKFLLWASLSPGVALVWRGLAATATPTQEWTLDGDKVHIKTTSLARTHEQEFTLGKEFDETRIDGEQCKVWTVNKLLV